MADKEVAERRNCHRNKLVPTVLEKLENHTIIKYHGAPNCPVVTYLRVWRYAMVITYTIHNIKGKCLPIFILLNKLENHTTIKISWGTKLSCCNSPLSVALCYMYAINTIKEKVSSYVDNA